MSGYTWRSGQGAPVDAEVFAAEVDRLHARDGVASPKAIVDEARDPRSPLHPAFEWDDDRAGELYRRSQARKFVRALVVVEEDESESTAFHNVRVVSDARRARGYVPQVEVLADEGLYAQTVASVRRQLLTLRGRHRELVELKGVWDEVDRLDDGE